MKFLYITTLLPKMKKAKSLFHKKSLFSVDDL